MIIKRQDAIDTIHKTIYELFGYQGGETFTDTDELLLTVNKLLCKKIREIPAADVLERKKGEWTDIGGIIRWGCPLCHHAYEHRYNFCPNCGADMREGEMKK